MLLVRAPGLISRKSAGVRFYLIGPDSKLTTLKWISHSMGLDLPDRLEDLFWWRAIGCPELNRLFFLLSWPGQLALWSVSAGQQQAGIGATRTILELDLTISSMTVVVVAAIHMNDDNRHLSLPLPTSLTLWNCSSRVLFEASTSVEIHSIFSILLGQVSFRPYQCWEL